MLERVCREGNPPHCWWKCKKTEIELPCDSENLLLGLGLEKTLNLKNYIYTMGHCIIFTIAKTWKQSKCPSTDKWVKKMWCIYTERNITQP